MSIFQGKVTTCTQKLSTRRWTSSLTQREKQRTVHETNLATKLGPGFCLTTGVYCAMGCQPEVGTPWQKTSSLPKSDKKFHFRSMLEEGKKFLADALCPTRLFRREFSPFP